MPRPSECNISSTMSARVTNGKRKRIEAPLQVSSKHSRQHEDLSCKCHPTCDDDCVPLEKCGYVGGEAQMMSTAAGTIQVNEDVAGREQLGEQAAEHFGIRWYGPTCVHDLMQTIPGLESVANDIFRKLPDIERIRGYMNEIEYYGQHCGDTASGPRKIHSHLVSLLPPKDLTDARVHLFHDVYGKIYHIFHLPTFWFEYEGLWEDLENCPTQLLAMVLLMVAASRGLQASSSSSRDGSVVIDSTVSAEDAIGLIASSERAIQVNESHSLATRNLQARFILAFTKTVVFPKFKTGWIQVQNLVQLYMGEGLHRDPDVIHLQLSAREKEIRRRMWYAAMELHVQVSVDQGLPPLPWPLHCDCKPPRNLVDSDVDVADVEDVLPQTRPARHRTHVSYLAMAAKSLPLRSQLSQDLNSSKEPLSFEEAKTRTDEIHSCLDKLPTWATASPNLPRALLFLKLYQYILIIHSARIYQDKTRSGRQFSAMMLWETALETIKIHTTFLNEGQLGLQSLCNDILRAAFCLCQLMISANGMTSESQVVAVRLSEIELNSLLDQAVEMTTNKLIRFGRERRHLFMILVAREHVRAKQDGKDTICLENILRAMVDSCHRAMESRATKSRHVQTP